MADRKLEHDTDQPHPDLGDATPPHGDELRSERSVGQTDEDTEGDARKTDSREKPH